MEMISGFGQFHTNEYDPEKPEKVLRPYISINWRQIQSMADMPPTYPKPDAQWVIPSNYDGRRHKDQELYGWFSKLWADIDRNQCGIDPLLAIVLSFINGADVEIYASRSATAENQKCRILIPLIRPLRFPAWHLSQQTLNDKLAAAGIEPDRASERAGQLCYLPNRGQYYRNLSVRNGAFFDPLTTWAPEIAAKRAELARQRAELEAARQQAIKNYQHIRPGNTIADLIAAFNSVYTPQDWLLDAGYSQRGNTFRHPNSESGSFSASVKPDYTGRLRVHSLSSSDPLYTGGRGVGGHDAFSTFATLKHSGNQRSAARDAAENILFINGMSWNQYNRQPSKGAA